MIWEEGQTLEKAPKHIEEKAIQAYQIDGNAQKAVDDMELIGETTSQDELLERFQIILRFLTFTVAASMVNQLVHMIINDNRALVVGLILIQHR